MDITLGYKFSYTSYYYVTFILGKMLPMALPVFVPVTKIVPNKAKAELIVGKQ